MLSSLLDRASTTARATAAVARTGLLGPGRPDVLARVGLEALRRGPVAGACTGAAIRWGDAPALHDELGTLSFRELDGRSNALANAWAADGVRARRRRSRSSAATTAGFLDATYAAAKVGLRSVFMNTEFAGPQIDDVCEREGVANARLRRGVRRPRSRVGRAPLPRLDRRRRRRAARSATLEELIAAGDPGPVPVPAEKPTMVMLTSGTTGTPKGAPRQEVGTITALGALLERVPFRTGECTYIAPPMFHALGFAHLSLALGLGSKVVTPAPLRRRGVPGRHRRAPRDGGDRRPGDAPAHARARRRADRRGRHVVAADHLLRRLAASRRGRDRDAGDVRRRPLRALRLDRGRLRVDLDAGRPPRRADHRRQAHAGDRSCGCSTTTAARCRTGETGRIFVSNGIEFEGYTDGTGKEVIGGRHVIGRRRPLRPRGAPVHRRPRRRHDRLRRRERLPAGGRGAPDGARAGRRRRRDRRGRRGLRQAPARVRRRRGRGAGRGGAQGVREGEPRALQGAARRASSSTSCRATRPARC